MHFCFCLARPSSSVKGISHNTQQANVCFRGQNFGSLHEGFSPPLFFAGAFSFVGIPGNRVISLTAMTGQLLLLLLLFLLPPSSFSCSPFALLIHSLTPLAPSHSFSCYSFLFLPQCGLVYIVHTCYIGGRLLCQIKYGLVVGEGNKLQIKLKWFISWQVTFVKLFVAWFSVELIAGKRS